MPSNHRQQSDGLLTTHGGLSVRLQSGVPDCTGYRFAPFAPRNIILATSSSVQQMDWSSSAENVNQYFMLKNTKVMIHRKIEVITAVNKEIWSACFFL